MVISFRQRVLYAALLISVGLAVGGSRLNGQEKPSVIFITIDTLRADHLSCYGYRQIQTPNIDGLARSTARFAQAFTPVPITLPAHSAIFTGSFPMATGMHDFTGNRLRSGAVTLAKVLHDNGYATAAFLGSAALDSHFGLNQGFDTYFDHFDITRLDETNPEPMERRGDLVVDEALAWLKTNPRRPFLVWVHLFDPHFPYTPPEPYASTYKSHLYDGEIAFADAQVGRLLSFLKEVEVLSNALVVLAGDHGEGLGEHGEQTHGFFLYNSTLHVPLLIKIPSAAPRVVEDEVSLVDVMPTILQALTIPVPPTVQGRSLLSEVMGRGTGTPSNLYAETYEPLLHFRWSQLRSLERQSLKYIQAPRPEIYDTRTDPHELRNLYGSSRTLAQEMRSRLFEVIRRFTPASSGASRAAKDLTDAALFERLRSLGYVAVSAGTMAEANGKPLPDPKDRIQVYQLIMDAMADCQHGRFQESLRKLGEAEKVEPASLPIRYFKGLDYFGMRDSSRAAEGFRAALQLDPNFTLAVYYLGLTEARLGNLDHAETSFRHALELDPANFSAAFDLGAVLLRKKQVDEALRQFQHAIEINPNYAPAYEALGELYLYLQRPDDAVRVLERAVTLSPGLRKAHYHLGRAYEARGSPDRAQREFDLAKEP